MRTAPLRLAVAATLLALLSTLGASCVDLLGLGGYTNAISSLCDMLAECYGASFYPKCVERAEQRLGGASPEQREAYLTAFADNSCLESCTNARACLDHQPICGTSGSSCGAAEQCCGFTAGSSQCVGGSCCAARGSACLDAGQCCDADCINGTCGGVECKDPDEPCNNDGECCGELVCGSLEQACVFCRPDYSECTTPADCCSGNCVYDMVEPVEGDPVDPPPVLGFCDIPSCGWEGAPCATPADCCEWLPFCVRVPGPGGESVCSEGDCLPFGTFFDTDEDCCNAYCNPLYGICDFAAGCGPVGSLCQDDPDCCAGECPNGTCCLADGLPCDFPTDCCGGKCDAPGFLCSGGDCQPEGAPCAGNPDGCCSHYCSTADHATGNCCPVFDNYCSHGVCDEGSPLRPDCGTVVINNGPEFGDATCIASVCAAMPECCCLGWDQACIAAVSEVCSGIACANTN